MVPSIKSRARPEAFSFFSLDFVGFENVLFFTFFQLIFHVFYFFFYFLPFFSLSSIEIDRFCVVVVVFFSLLYADDVWGDDVFVIDRVLPSCFFGVASIFIELGWPCSAVLFFFWLPGFVIFIGFFSSVDSVLPGRTGFYRVFLSFFYRVLKRLPSFSWL